MGPVLSVSSPVTDMVTMPLCCGTGGERITKHNVLRDHLHQLAASAALSPTKDSRFLLPGQDRRPADVFIPSWAGGMDAALDITVVNPLQSALVDGAAVTPGHALDYRFRTKMAGAAEDCRQEGIKIPPDCDGNTGWVAQGCREAGEETSSSQGKALGPGRRGSLEARLHKTLSTPNEGKCSYPQQ